MDVRLVPNPNKGAFSLQGTLATASNEELNVEVTNMLGQVVYSGKVKANAGAINERIELSNAASGMYLLNLSTGNDRAVFHFVIE